MELSKRQNIIVEWAMWQFFDMPKFLLGVWKNYIIFALNYFSLPILAKSLFAPWRRYRWNYPKGFNIGEFFTTLISNAISRLLGAVVRIILIITGIFFQIFVLLAGLVAFLAWIILPIAAAAGLLIVILN